jgi:hypothetical protein
VIDRIGTVESNEKNRYDPYDSPFPGHNRKIAYVHGGPITIRKPRSIPCSFPELEGIWDYGGDGYRIVWKYNRFVASKIHGN